MHLQDTAQALALTLGRVEHRRTGADRTRVDAEEGQTAYIRVGHDLECQRGERSLVGRRTLVLFLGVRVDALDRGDIGRRGHIVYDCVQQQLDALVAVSSTTQDRDDLYIADALAQRSLDLIHGDLLALEVLHHEVLVQLSDRLDQLVVILLRLIHHVSRDVLIADVLAQVIVVDLSAHLDQVDHAAERVFRADRQLDRNCITLEAILHHVDNIEEVCAHDVHLVDERHTRDMILVGLVPNGLGLGLNAALCAEYRDRTIEYAQGTLYLNGEVNVARGVDDVDAVILPVAGGRSGGDGDTTLLLLLHPVHGRGTVMGIADLIVYAGVIQDTLGRSGFTGIDVSHDADISRSFKRILSRHICSPFKFPPSINNGSERMPCSPLPSCAYPHAS